jgi:peptidyl-prolyl cis-trans isomerase A (cyclophilin A)
MNIGSFRPVRLATWKGICALTLQAAALAIVTTNAAAQSTPTAAPSTEHEALVYVALETSKGEILLELNQTRAPKTVANFLSYIERQFYDNTLFHRVLAGMVIQGGGYNADLVEKPAGEPIANEWNNGLKNVRGAVAMARMPGEPKSARSQFFINVVDNPTYDRPLPDGAGYAVFGRVAAGMKVVDAIRMVEVKPKPPDHDGVPVEPVVIRTVRVVSEPEALAKVEADKPRRRVPREPVPERAAPSTPSAPAEASSPSVQSQTRPDQPAPSAPGTGVNALEYVLMTTSKGEVVIELDRDRAPISVTNFLAYVDKKFYDGTIFHRIIPTFMIQGGGFTPDMQEKPGDAPIPNEWQNGLKNTRGTLAMARLGSQADSATSQFFINVVDNAFLDQPRDGAGYAVFGKVIAGMDVVDAIRVVPTTVRGLHQGVPVEPVVIQSMTRLTKDQAIEKTKAPGG